MSNIQVDLIYFLNNGLQNPFLDWIVPVIYSITDIKIVFAIIILALIGSWALKKDKVGKVAIICILGFVLTCIIAFILKKFYPSIRPINALEGIRMIIHDDGFYSFPSGHFAISTMTLSVILMNVEKHRTAWLTVAIIYLLVLAFVLIYGGIHYPTDIITGGIIGVVSAAIAVYYLGFITQYCMKKMFRHEKG